MGKAVPIEIDGVEYPSIKDMCKALNLNYNTFKQRRNRGWSIKEQLQGYRNSDNSIIVNRNTINNKIIHTMDELVESIKLFPDIKRINLIDYENVSDNKLLIHNHINDPDIINIFFFNACIYSNNYFNLSRETKGINFQLIVTRTGDQLIDHTITFYLGVLAYNFPDKEIKIFAKDSGYLAFINNLELDNIRMGNLRRCTKKGYKYSLASYIINNEDINKNKYFYKTDFKKLFIEFYSAKDKRCNKHTINNLIKELERFNFITSIDIEERQYRFCIDDIKKYINITDNKED